jgi:hypothetical protein
MFCLYAMDAFDSFNLSFLKHHTKKFQTYLHKKISSPFSLFSKMMLVIGNV